MADDSDSDTATNADATNQMSQYEVVPNEIELSVYVEASNEQEAIEKAAERLKTDLDMIDFFTFESNRVSGASDSKQTDTTERVEVLFETGGISDILTSTATATASLLDVYPDVSVIAATHYPEGPGQVDVGVVGVLVRSAALDASLSEEVVGEIDSVVEIIDRSEVS